MEFYLSRAFNIARLKEGQIKELHEYEDKPFPVYKTYPGRHRVEMYLSKKVLFPNELEAFFKMSHYRKHYDFSYVKDKFKEQMEDIKGRLKELRIVPEYDFLILDVDRVHNFDRAIYAASTEKRVTFFP